LRAEAVFFRELANFIILVTGHAAAVGLANLRLVIGHVEFS
jgi:hypothetical protein